MKASRASMRTIKTLEKIDAVLAQLEEELKSTKFRLKTIDERQEAMSSLLATMGEELVDASAKPHAKSASSLHRRQLPGKGG